MNSQIKTHRAKAILDEISRRYPCAWAMAEEARSSAAWAAHCFLPLSFAGRIALAHLSDDFGARPPLRSFGYAASEIAALAAWRMTQGIYRYDQTLYESLIDTPVTGDIPADVLRRMPEWCVYIETPGMTAATSKGPTPLHGFFACMDNAAHHPADTLMILLDADEMDALGRRLTPTHIPLIGTLDQAITLVQEEWIKAWEAGKTHAPPRAELLHEAKKSLPPMISLLLYLCADPDIMRRGQPASPTKPVPVRTRRHGVRLFPAQSVTPWDVGVRIGAAIRQHASNDRQADCTSNSPDRHLRPHVRRAHWHTILSGPRLAENGTPIPSSQRRSDVRWMPPIPINLEDVYSLAATIRPTH